MNIDNVIDCVISIVNFFLDIKILGLPVLIWSIIPIIVGIILNFFVGEKGSSKK